MALSFAANVISYNDFKTVANYSGTSNFYCLYYADANPTFIAMLVSIPLLNVIVYKDSITTPGSFTSDFPNALQINNWVFNNVAASSTITLTTYSDFKDVINYLGLGNRILYYSTGGTFGSYSYTTDNQLRVVVTLTGGIPGTFLTDFPSAVQLDGASL